MDACKLFLIAGVLFATAYPERMLNSLVSWLLRIPKVLRVSGLVKDPMLIHVFSSVQNMGLTSHFRHLNKRFGSEFPLTFGFGGILCIRLLALADLRQIHWGRVPFREWLTIALRSLIIYFLARHFYKLNKTLTVCECMKTTSWITFYQSKKNFDWQYLLAHGKHIQKWYQATVDAWAVPCCFGTPITRLHPLFRFSLRPPRG